LFSLHVTLGHRMSDVTPTLAQRFAAFTTTLAAPAIPDEAIGRAKLNVLDALGIGLASSTYDFAERTARGLRDLGETGDSPVLGRGERLALREKMGLDRPVLVQYATWLGQALGWYGPNEGAGLIGAVVGATWPRQLDAMRAAMPHAWILVPGFGKQGGRAADVRGAFHSDGLGALVVSARDVIFAHARPEMNAGLSDAQWQTAVERACRDMIERLAADTPAGRLTS
jgi:hypothetical protein